MKWIHLFQNILYSFEFLSSLWQEKDCLTRERFANHSHRYFWFQRGSVSLKKSNLLFWICLKELFYIQKQLCKSVFHRVWRMLASTVDFLITGSNVSEVFPHSQPSWIQWKLSIKLLCLLGIQVHNVFSITICKTAWKIYANMFERGRYTIFLRCYFDIQTLWNLVCGLIINLT